MASLFCSSTNTFRFQKFAYGPLDHAWTTNQKLQPAKKCNPIPVFSAAVGLGFTGAGNKMEVSVGYIAAQLSNQGVMDDVGHCKKMMSQVNSRIEPLITHLQYLRVNCSFKCIKAGNM